MASGCSTPDCGRDVLCRGMCNRCYQRAVKNGLPRKHAGPLRPSTQYTQRTEQISIQETANDQGTYAIRAVSGGPVKIGRTANFESRKNELQRYCPYPLEFVWTTPNDYENDLHEVLQPYRTHGEWFDLGQNPLPRIREAMKEVVGRHEKRYEDAGLCLQEAQDALGSLEETEGD